MTKKRSENLYREDPNENIAEDSTFQRSKSTLENEYESYKKNAGKKKNFVDDKPIGGGNKYDDRPIGGGNKYDDRPIGGGGGLGGGNRYDDRPIGGAAKYNNNKFERESVKEIREREKRDKEKKEREELERQREERQRELDRERELEKKKDVERLERERSRSDAKRSEGQGKRNILKSILLLLDELSGQELEFVRGEIDRKLDEEEY